jgi:outer membrane biosynthesis protein TonB
MRVRKKHPGSSSHGHVWDEAGQVLDIPVEDAADCMRVAPDEFEVLPDEPEAPEDPPPPPPEDPEPVKEPVTEPEPEPQPEEAPAEPEPKDQPAEAKKPATRGRGRSRVTED